MPADVLGRYTYSGSANMHGAGDELYSGVRITFTWNRLQVHRGSAGAIIGVSDVSISANGPQGRISKNARLTFDGTNRALLAIGGRDYRVDIERSLIR